MVDVNPVNKNTSVNVSSSGTVSQIKTTTPQSYFDGLSKQWAISEDKVQGLDYSSKYYAQQAKENSQEAISALENVETVTTNAINQITTTKNETLDGIYDISSQTQQEITELKETLKTDLENTKVNAIDEVVQNKTNAIEEIETLSNETLSDIKAQGVDSRANLDLSNLSEVGEKHFLNKSQITNCITEIPQRIKYTLEDGTLTILAGSVVIFPYGTKDLTEQYLIGSTFLHEDFKVVDTQFIEGKFFVWAELQVDRSRTTTNANEDLVINFYCSSSENGYSASYISNFASGTTPPTNFKIYYNTETNYIIATTLAERTYCLPCMITTGAHAAIKEVFNGFGYIGSTVWVDKGVKCLIPNDRNEDGTLKNTEYTTTFQIYNKTGGNTSNANVFTFGEVSGKQVFTYCQDRYTFTVKTQSEAEKLMEDYATSSIIIYVEETNSVIAKTSTGNVTINKYIMQALSVMFDTNYNVTSFQPKQPFRALDYNNKSEVSSWSMPSNKYIDLELGASGTTYTAPANGWLTVNITATTLRVDTSKKMFGGSASNQGSINTRWCIELCKGDTFVVRYSAIELVGTFAFVYAEGEV